MKMNRKLVFLIGFMGSGKSTIGKRMAKQLNYQFIDTDQYIEKMEGKTIAQLFEEIGESGFRKREMAVLNDLESLETNHVIATGGGMPCSQARLDKMLEMGTVIYLEIDAKSVLQRVSQGKNERPILSGLTPSAMDAKIRELMKKRLPYYEQANLTISSLDAKKIDFNTLLN